MSANDNPLLNHNNLPIVGAEWIQLVEKEMFWEEHGASGKYLVWLIYTHFGREPCEAVALYWMLKGRNDIAAQVKDVIHKQGDVKKT